MKVLIQGQCQALPVEIDRKGEQARGVDGLCYGSRQAHQHRSGFAQPSA
jgi:hypothetical protein